MEKPLSLKERMGQVRLATVEHQARSDALVRDLIAVGCTDGALKQGDRCPDFALPNAEGLIVSSISLLAKGPLVLSFYRGRWCPFCVTAIEALGEVAELLGSWGVQIAAVTAEATGAAAGLKRDKNLKMEILCDLENGLGLAFGLLFRLPDYIREAYSQIDIDFPDIYGNESWLLPIPATYVIGQDGVIAYAHINPDFRERLDPQELVEVLRDLRKER